MSVEARGELHTLVDHLPDAAVAEVLHYARRLAAQGPGDAGMPAAWSLPDGHYLLQGAAEPLPHRLPAGIRLPTGEVIHAAVPYYLVTPAGAVARTYPAPRAFSLEDTLYLTPIYAVIDGLLVQFLWEEQFGGDAPEVKGQGAALSGLTACPPGALPFDPAAVIAGRDGASDAVAGSAPARPAGPRPREDRPLTDGVAGWADAVRQGATAR